MLCLGVLIAATGCTATPQAATPHAAAFAPPSMGHDVEPQDKHKNTGDVPSNDTETNASADADDRSGETEDPPCDTNMMLLDSAALRFCIDRYEASLVEALDDGTEAPYPHYLPVDGHVVRAVSEPGVFPQGFISEVQAADACAASGKRLCTYEEWQTTCMGPSKTTFPYGDTRKPGTCHDTGKSAVGAVFGAKALALSSAPSPPAARSSPKVKPKQASQTKSRGAQSSNKTRTASTKTPKTRTRTASTKTPKTKAVARATKSPSDKPGKTDKPSARKPAKVAKPSARPASVEPSVWTRLNEPALGQVEGALARTGEHDECVNEYGVYDMVGNLHEWVATDPKLPRGTFAGGYYLDTTQNGPGCYYKTQAHAHEYHDYSTGFRCCSDPR
jgi:hypothetical protein